MATLTVDLDDELIEAVHRRAQTDGVTLRDIVVHALEYTVAVRDLLDQEPETCPEGWIPLSDGTWRTPDELHMQIAINGRT